MMAFARLGLAADSGASVTLQRLAGAAKAAELLMLAEPVDAERALAAGLFTTVVTEDEVMPEATRLARRLAEGPTAAYAGIKDQLLYSASHGLAESLEHEAQVQAELGKTADHRAATLAFTRKERPVYQGR
jgi:2-(1,2-epoxy-1,2-dihydrophenyl)acetyl-CoA isomerase